MGEEQDLKQSGLSFSALSPVCKRPWSCRCRHSRQTQLLASKRCRGGQCALIVDHPYFSQKIASALSSAQAVSATTKKRLLVKAVHGLQKGKDGLQVCS
jgi:hypothetical protein